MTLPARRVSAHLAFRSFQPLRMMVQVAVADMPPAEVLEQLDVRLDGVPLDVDQVRPPAGGRIHTARIPAGRVTIDYEATVRGSATAHQVSEADRIIYVRPSRYAESDRLMAVAKAEFAGITGPAELLDAVSSWVGTQLSYVPGSSGPTDGAVDTLLLRQGVCRDYAHLVIALLRGLDIPARLAAVYAPGLSPMDFHAVAEAAVDDEWRVVDATALAPRQSLVRITAGRDAADTAFLSTYGGGVEIDEQWVTAVVDGELPRDDIRQLVSLG